MSDLPRKVSLIVPGKFHHFHLARQLLRREMLERVFTFYPIQKLMDQGIPPERIRPVPYLFLLWHLIQGTSLRGGDFARGVNWEAAKFLATTAAGEMLDTTEVIIGLSGSGLESGRKIKSRGGIYICDRGSSHIRYQNRLIAEEFARWKQSYRQDDERVMAREEEEYELADCIVIPSEFTKRSFLEHGVPRQKLRKVPYGVDLSRFGPIEEPDANTFDVLFVGGVSFRKGFPYLLEAFGHFKHPSKRLRVAGHVSPEIERYLKDFRPTLDHVEFLGVIPHSNLKRLMSSSHALVLPSLEEGLALVQGEALACGCPVISSAHSGGEDLFQDGVEGFIVPIRDSLSISDRLTHLAGDRELQQNMRAAAIDGARRIGGWDGYGSNMVSVIHEACLSKSKSHAGSS